MTLSGKRFHHLQEKVLANGETLSDLDENFEYVEQEIAKFQSRIASEYFNYSTAHVLGTLIFQKNYQLSLIRAHCPL